MRMAGEDPHSQRDPTYRRMRLITGNMRRRKRQRVLLLSMAGKCGNDRKNIIEGEGIERYEIDWKMPENNIIEQAKGRKGPSRTKKPTIQSMISFMRIRQLPCNAMIMGADMAHVTQL